MPGGGLSPDGLQWLACRPGFFLSVRVLSRLFRRLFLDKLSQAYRDGNLQFFGRLHHLVDPQSFADFLSPLRKLEWYLYAKPPFAGPDAVLQYLSRYTHRVAIANSRLIAHDERGVSFRYKDYQRNGRERYKTMTLEACEFIRRFLIHVLPKGLHRIRHYGLLANGARVSNLQLARRLLSVVESTQTNDDDHCQHPNRFVCPECGAAMRLIDAFKPLYRSRAPPALPP